MNGETLFATTGPMRNLRFMSRLLPLCLMPLGLAGCIHVSMDPIEVHAVVDVNVKMEKAVTDILSDIYGDSATVNTNALPTPTAAP